MYSSYKIIYSIGWYCESRRLEIYDILRLFYSSIRELNVTWTANFLLNKLLPIRNGAVG